MLGSIFMAGIVSGAGAQDNKQNRKPNRLLGVESPYLQQHVYNAVSWYP